MLRPPIVIRRNGTPCSSLRSLSFPSKEMIATAIRMISVPKPLIRLRLSPKNRIPIRITNSTWVLANGPIILALPNSSALNNAMIASAPNKIVIKRVGRIDSGSEIEIGVDKPKIGNTKLTKSNRLLNTRYI